MDSLQYCIVIRKYHCFHGKQKSKCVTCGGSEICIHNREKYTCKECGGSGICEHGRRRSRCLDCKGSGICIHNKQKYRCIYCNGGSICIHNKRREYCKPCGGSELCKSSWCPTKKNKKYNGYCVLCFTHLFPDTPLSRRYKTKEQTVVDFIKESFPDYDWTHDKRIVDGCSRRRPDMLVDLGSHLIIIEVDEYRHDTYTTECEITRLNDISLDVNCRPIIMIRFNPDSYVDSTGKNISSCWGINNLTQTLMIKKMNEWNCRLDRLKNEIIQSVINPIKEPINIIELFY